MHQRHLAGQDHGPFDAGFIAAGATVASQDVNFTLVPEVPFVLDGEDGFLAALKQRVLSGVLTPSSWSPKVPANTCSATAATSSTMLRATSSSRTSAQLLREKHRRPTSRPRDIPLRHALLRPELSDPQRRRPAPRTPSCATPSPAMPCMRRWPEKPGLVIGYPARHIHPRADRTADPAQQKHLDLEQPGLAGRAGLDRTEVRAVRAVDRRGGRSPGWRDEV